MKTNQFMQLCRILISLIFGLSVQTISANELAFSKPIRINGNLQPMGDVFDVYLISPDNDFVLHIADKEIDERYELFIAPVRGGAEIKLNPTLIDGGDVRDDFQFSPNGKTVVYIADQEANNKFELFSVPSQGGTVIKLNGELADRENHGVVSFEISSDGSRVIYAADQTNGDNPNTQIYSVPIGGGNPVRLNKLPEPEGNSFVREFAVTPDGSTIIYRAPADNVNADELFSVSVDGGESIKLNGPLLSAGDVVDFRISHSGEFVVYLADQFTFRKRELFKVPTMGGDALKVHPEFDVSRTIRTNYQISSDDRFVVYELDKAVENDHELFSSDLSIGTPNQTKISEPGLAGTDVGEFWIAANSDRVIYTADQDPNREGELYSTEISQANAVALHEGLPPTAEIDEISLDNSGRFAVFSANNSLYRRNLSGGNIVELKSDNIANEVDDFSIAPNGEYVVYLADQDDNGDTEIYAVSPEGGASTSLLGSAPIDRVFNEYFEISSDSRYVVYWSNLEDQTKDELYTVSLLDQSLCFPIKSGAGSFTVVCV